MKIQNPVKDYLSVALSTVGVGFIPLAPGTWGSFVGVLIYIGYSQIIDRIGGVFLGNGYSLALSSAFFVLLTSILFLSICFLSFWASSRAVLIFDKKDPQRVVIDEVIGQLLVFAFVPWRISNWIIFAGFIFFRLFDITKPYPVKQAEALPVGLGICADDLVAGIYGGCCLSGVYFLSLYFA